MHFIFLILLIIFLLTYFVGSYFVNYALIPNSGAQNRQVDTKQPLPTHEEIDPIAKRIENNMSNDITLRDAWMDKMNLDACEVQIESNDGLKLVGHAFKQDTPTNKWVIACHGYQSGEGETFLIGRHFYERGFNVLTFSFRAHGKSEGQYIGMGYLDKNDLISWTKALVDQYPDSEIFYHGTSMGGATVLMASGTSLPANVKAIVSDCAFTGIWDIFASEIKKRFNLPPFPILHMAHIMGIVKAGYNIKDGNVIKFVQKSTLPILFIHTADDDFVPVEMMHQLYNAKEDGPKEMYLLEEGGHAEAKYVEPVAYYERIFTFIEQYIS